MIYIVVAPSEPLLLRDKMSEDNNDQRSKEDLDQKAFSKYYIGISVENNPLSIKEGIPHTMTLSGNYRHQLYQRIHTNIKKDLQIILNVLMGEIHIFASIKFLTEENISNIDLKNAKYSTKTDTYEIDKIKFKLNLKSFSYFQIENNFINDNIYYPNVIFLYYYIRRSESMSRENQVWQYVFLEKTSEKKGQILQTGVVSSGNFK